MIQAASHSAQAALLAGDAAGALAGYRAAIAAQPESPEAHRELVHLEASLQTVLLRCQGTESIRPVLQDQVNLENRYQRRLPLYRESHLTVVVDSLPPGAVVESILENIRF